MDGIKLMTVGIGTCVPQPGVASACVLMETGRRSWLVDVGTGAIQGLLELGRDPLALDGVFLTHHHPDHSGELPALLQAIVWGRRTPREKAFYLTGGPDTQALTESWSRFFGDWVYGRGFEVRVLELSHGDATEVDDLTVRVVQPEHSESSLAYRFERGSRTAVVTGDTGPCPAVEELARGSDLLCVECSFPDDQPRSGHMTPAEAGKLAAAAGVGTVVLTHMYPECDPGSACRIVEGLFTGKVVLARHGLELEV
jgi:ribonuclease BN (tRNA processing enzyme)